MSFTVPVIQPVRGFVQRYNITLKYREQQQAALTVLLNRGGRSIEKKSSEMSKTIQAERNSQEQKRDCSRENSLVEASLRMMSFSQNICSYST